MLNEIILLKAFVVLVILLPYISWRKYAALKARETMASSLESFLSKDVPEEMKEFAFKFFRSSMFSLFSPIMMISIISGFFVTEENHEASQLSEKVNNATNDQIDEFKEIIGQGVVVVFKRAPITTFICLIVLLMFTMLRALLNKLSLSNSILVVEDSLDKTARHFN